ncbi:helix-turn-helix domain-containing protein [Pelagicoccus sp. SDUM812002]|nr:helix-turn-helix domain-containing protein [Pelagicoccus sp. SDUM812002]
MGRPDHHNEIELNLMSKGWVSYLLGGSKVTLSAGQLGAFWASIPHQVIDYADDTEYFVVTIPFSWFLQFNLPEPFTQTLLKGVLVNQRLRGRVETEAERFAQWEFDLTDAPGEMQDVVLLELQARLKRMAHYAQQEHLLDKGSQDSKTALQDGSLNKVEQIACLIAQRYLEPLTSESIAKSVGLHPNYAMNLFKKTFGTTLVDYITHHRISHAQRLLITTNDKILDIAMASGFNTLSRFNEAFRRSCNCTPRQYRASQHAMRT